MSLNSTVKVKAIGCKNSWLVLDTQNSPPSWSFGILIGFTCILEFISSLLNICVFVGLIRLWRSNTHRSVSVLINLVVTDLIYNFTAELLYTIHLILQQYDIIICNLIFTIGVFGLFLCLVSFLMLVLATIERYVAIFYPFRHVQYSNSKISFICIGVVYVLSVSFTIMFRLSNFSFASGISVLALLTLGGILMVFAFGRILLLTQRVKKDIERLKVGNIEGEMAGNRPRLMVPGEIGSDMAENRTAGRKKLRKWRQHQRNAVLIALLLSCLLSCYLPYLIGVSLFVFGKSAVKVTKETLHWLWMFMLVNATLNPVLFFFCDKEIRFHIMKALGFHNRIEPDAINSKTSRSSSIATNVSPQDVS
eukprot:gene12686-3399_t